MFKDRNTVLLPVIFLLIGAVLGVTASSFLPFPKNFIKTDPLRELASKNTFFKTQLATIEGSVSGVKGKMIIIKNDQNQTGEFEAAESLTVFKKDDPSKPFADAFSGVSFLENGREARLVLELTGDKYLVTSVHYFMPTTQTSPAVQATRSATPNQR